MAGLGDEVAKEVLNLGERATRLLMQFLRWVTSEFRKSGSGLTREDIKQREALREINKKSGYVNAVKMQRLQKRSGERLVPLGIFLPVGQTGDLHACLKREGVLYTGISDAGAKMRTEGGQGEVYEQLYCFEKDLPRMQDGINRYNDEQRIKRLDEEIKKISGMPESERTEEDMATLREYMKEKERIQQDGVMNLNRDTTESMLANLPESKAKREHTLDQVLDRDTGRYLDKDLNTVVVDARDPHKMIECHGYAANDAPDGKAYIKTEYTVHDGKGNTKTFEDGYHDGVKGSWRQTKNAIAATTEFSGAYYKFANQKEYEGWAKSYMEQNRTELSIMDKPHAERDYNAINASLDNKLKEDGAYVKGGVVYDAATNKTMQSIRDDGNMSQMERARASEAIAVHEQINTCNDILKAEDNITVARAQQMMSKNGSREFEAAASAEAAAREKFNVSQSKYDELLSERKDINSTQAYQENEVQQALEQQKADPNYAKYEEEMAERFDREERGDSQQMEMEEIREEIQDRRADEGAKGNDFADRNTQREAAQTAKPDVRGGGDR